MHEFHFRTFDIEKNVVYDFMIMFVMRHKY